MILILIPTTVCYATNILHTAKAVLISTLAPHAFKKHLCLKLIRAYYVLSISITAWPAPIQLFAHTVMLDNQLSEDALRSQVALL